ncbi:MAG: sulfur carrier protein ThiS [Phycisphaeraceae bacterium]
MNLVVNGKDTELPRARTVADLVAQLGLGGRAVAVEVNKAIVPRKRHESTPLRDGDVVEIVTLVGGG